VSSSISVLGAGSWGTALAILAARNGCQTLLWGHNSAHISSLNNDRKNNRYLPGIELPDSLRITDNFEQAISFSSLILISVPSHAFRQTLINLAPHLSNKTKIAWATKGFDPDEGLLLSQIAEQILSKNTQTAVLSGPTFAQEVANGLPTAMTVASLSPEFSNSLANLFTIITLELTQARML
jgi:glycerol-3-phosphate dehydrogenase (NAD(P)+)